MHVEQPALQSSKPQTEAAKPMENVVTFSEAWCSVAKKAPQPKESHPKEFSGDHLFFIIRIGPDCLSPNNYHLGLLKAPASG